MVGLWVGKGQWEVGMLLLHERQDLAVESNPLQSPRCTVETPLGAKSIKSGYGCSLPLLLYKVRKQQGCR